MRMSIPPKMPAPTPATIPQPIWVAALLMTADGTLPSSVAIEISIATRKKGTARPSLRPLSTSSAWRTRAGTAGSSTTRWPSAASVEQSMVERRNALARPMPGNRNQPAPKPITMVRGRPTSNNRPGQRRSRRSDPRSRRAESLKSRNTRASSVTRSATALSRPTSSSPRPEAPTTKPTATKTIAEVMPRRSSGAEIEP